MALSLCHVSICNADGYTYMQGIIFLLPKFFAFQIKAQIHFIYISDKCDSVIGMYDIPKSRLHVCTSNGNLYILRSHVERKRPVGAQMICPFAITKQG